MRDIFVEVTLIKSLAMVTKLRLLVANDESLLRVVWKSPWGSLNSDAFPMCNYTALLLYLLEQIHDFLFFVDFSIITDLNPD